MPWSHEEDLVILKILNEIQTRNWGVIASIFHERTGVERSGK